MNSRWGTNNETGCVNEETRLVGGKRKKSFYTISVIRTSRYIEEIPRYSCSLAMLGGKVCVLGGSGNGGKLIYLLCQGHISSSPESNASTRAVEDNVGISVVALSNESSGFLHPVSEGTFPILS